MQQASDVGGPLGNSASTVDDNLPHFNPPPSRNVLLISINIAPCTGP
jgi:hypothetical protein